MTEHTETPTEHDHEHAQAQTTTQAQAADTEPVAETPDEAAEDEAGADVNISKLREMALRGDNYREVMEFTYYGETEDLYVGPLADPQFLPIAALLEERMDMDPEEAQEALEEEKDPDTGVIDASQFDEEFVAIMGEAAVMGIDRSQGIAHGETEQGIREILGLTDDGGIGLQGGKTLEIAERVLSMSSDAETAESFRRDGGGQ